MRYTTLIKLFYILIFFHLLVSAIYLVYSHHFFCTYLAVSAYRQLILAGENYEAKCPSTENQSALGVCLKVLYGRAV